jgi:hypothetical protein
VLNALNHFRFELKSPGNQAAELNCRDRQKDLTPDTVHQKKFWLSGMLARQQASQPANWPVNQ